MQVIMMMFMLLVIFIHCFSLNRGRGLKFFHLICMIMISNFYVIHLPFFQDKETLIQNQHHSKADYKRKSCILSNMWIDQRALCGLIFVHAHYSPLELATW